MARLIKILIGVWLLIAATGIIKGIYDLFTSGIKDAMLFFVIAAVSVIMYFINKRRFKMYVQNPAQNK